jgi:hypothetical protein
LPYPFFITASQSTDMAKYEFTVGSKYKRSEVRQVVGLDPKARGGPWYTGYVEHNDVDFIFCVVGAAGRTGHNYGNYFDGEDLVWYGKTASHRDQPMIRRMTTAGAEVHIFWRTSDRDPFTYQGLGSADSVSGDSPVQVRWTFRTASAQVTGPSQLPELLSVEVLDKVTPEHMWRAVQQLVRGMEHPFGPSTDYDLIADDDHRLPPKAVFGVAASIALGMEVLPKRFKGGEGSKCFRALRSAGYLIVPKDAETPTPAMPTEEEDELWSEGAARLVSHLRRERARGLSKAKKAQFRRLHGGRLHCESCGLVPLESYLPSVAEACIEVHHREVQVASMPDGHQTSLDDLQCLCANCHRIVHAEARLPNRHQDGGNSANIVPSTQKGEIR